MTSPTKSLLIPAKRFVRQTGSFTWPQKPALASPRSDDVLPLSQLSKDLTRRIGAKSHIERNAFGPADVRIRRDRKIRNTESYKITVSPKGIEIFASDDAGAYYAVQTLRELLAIYGGKLPACKIEDWPDFPRRGIYHDCSRGKVPTLDTLKELAERLAHWKVNELQLYVENVFTFKRHPAIGRGYSPFTPEEILSLQDHCKRHHIRLVGSLASFGHMERILVLPQYRHLAELPGHMDYPGGTTLCPTDPRSIKFMEELYDEFVPLFEAEDFNVCCDETWELGEGRSKKWAERIGVGRLYLDFLKKIHRLCEKHGKRMNVWADIAMKYPKLLKRLPKDIVMLHWAYEKDSPEIARTKEIKQAGLPLVVCPGTSSSRTHGTRMPNAVDNVSRFAAAGRKYHAEGLLNTDWGNRGHRNFLAVSLHGFAHGAAHAWNGRAVDDKTFTETFCSHVFGRRDKRLANSLRLLGNTYLQCGAPRTNACSLSYILTEPLMPKKPDGHGQIDNVTKSGLRKIIEQLSDSQLWPALPKGTDRFEATAMREFALAARMSVLASRRALAGKEL
ncbi:MAG: family 20 glycosylhydrolase, partial [Phycisphaerae bacterium]|nr:family 20 glycosylhydrolase [Phycisphaerae bacterium]